MPFYLLREQCRNKKKDLITIITPPMFVASTCVFLLWAFKVRGLPCVGLPACVRVCNLQLCVLSCSVVQFLHSKHMFTFSLQRDSGPSLYLLLWFHQLMSLSDSTHTHTDTHACTQKYEQRQLIRHITNRDRHSEGLVYLSHPLNE